MANNFGNADADAGVGSSTGPQRMDQENQISIKIVSLMENVLHITVDRLLTIPQLKLMIVKMLSITKRISLRYRERELLQGTLSANGVVHDSTIVVSIIPDDVPMQAISPGERNVVSSTAVSKTGIIQLVAPTSTQPPLADQNGTQQATRAIVNSTINNASQSVIQQSTAPRLELATVSNPSTFSQGYALLGMAQQITTIDNRPMVTLTPILALLPNTVVINAGSNVPVSTNNVQSQPSAMKEMQQENGKLRAQLAKMRSYLLRMKKRRGVPKAKSARQADRNGASNYPRSTLFLRKRQQFQQRKKPTTTDFSSQTDNTPSEGENNP